MERGVVYGSEGWRDDGGSRVCVEGEGVGEESGRGIRWLGRWRSGVGMGGMCGEWRDNVGDMKG